MLRSTRLILLLWTGKPLYTSTHSTTVVLEAGCRPMNMKPYLKQGSQLMGI